MRSGRGYPGELKPNQTKPNQTKPNQTKPNQTKPNQTKPNQTKPNQTKPNNHLICMLKEHLEVGALGIEQRASLVKSVSRYSSLRVYILQVRVAVSGRRELGAKILSMLKICSGQVARFEEVSNSYSPRSSMIIFKNRKAVRFSVNG
jgi:hypothetical protein